MAILWNTPAAAAGRITTSWPSAMSSSGWLSVDPYRKEASVGLMIWDGESVGTLVNMARLLRRGKSVVAYIVPDRRFVPLSSRDDWERLVSAKAGGTRHKALRSAFEPETSPTTQTTLL